MKKCTKCEQTKDFDSFAKHKGHKDGLSSHCKSCKAEKDREYWSSVPKGERTSRQRNTMLRHRYGISACEYDEMLASQNGCCAICFGTDIRRLAVDHDHRTGMVRQLLCSKCNLAIGYLNDDIRLAESLCAYIRRHA